MNAPADALVLVFTYGVSLRTWADTGGIARELALYERLADHYERIVLVTYGGPDEEALLRAHAPHSGRFSVVCNRARLSTVAYAEHLPTLVAQELKGVDRIVVKTNQMCGGEVAVAITARLRSLGRCVALVARGGYLWSRMAAYEHGPNSSQALVAAGTEGILCPVADVVVGTTQDMIDDLAWRYGLNPQRTLVIPNYVIAPDAAAPGAESRTPGLILYAGQLIRRKRVDILIDAVAALPEDVRSACTLEIIGDGVELGALREQAARTSAPVVFKDRLPHQQLLQRMSECAIYAQASEMEGHPKTVLEALAAGAPVIVADMPGLSETVTHGVTGLRIQNTPDAFCQAFTELLADPEWRDMLGAGAARSTRSALSLDAIVPKELAAHSLAIEHAEHTRVAAPRAH